MVNKMNNEFFEALQMLEREKGIKADYLIEKISNAILIAVKKDYEVADNVTIIIDPDSFRFNVSITKMVVDIIETPETEILLDEAIAYDPNAKIGFPCVMHLDPKKFGRIAAQTAKHVIRQGIREAERSQLMEQFQEKVCEIVTAVVNKVEPGTGNATVEIDHNEFMLFKNDQLPGDDLHEGDRIKVYVVDVVNLDKRASLKISRTHKDLVKRLFELEVPEIFDGTIEVKSISREAGSRTKIAVTSKNPDVDPIGACIGPKGSRISSIVEELGGEKIDIVRYSEDDAQFIKEALSPATVTDVQILPGEEKACRVTVPDTQLSLAIGNRGQNAKLAAKLTGYKIDIRSENEAAREAAEATDENEELFIEEPAAEETAPAAEEPISETIEEEETV
jgi:N utilization substance protein A